MIEECERRRSKRKGANAMNEVDGANAMNEVERTPLLCTRFRLF